jgi:hypothetical protein
MPIIHFRDFTALVVRSSPHKKISRFARPLFLSQKKTAEPHAGPDPHQSIFPLDSFSFSGRGSALDPAGLGSPAPTTFETGTTPHSRVEIPTLFVGTGLPLLRCSPAMASGDGGRRLLRSAPFPPATVSVPYKAALPQLSPNSPAPRRSPRPRRHVDLPCLPGRAHRTLP